MVFLVLISTIVLSLRLLVAGTAVVPTDGRRNFYWMEKTMCRDGLKYGKGSCLTMLLLASLCLMPGNSWAKDGKCLEGNCENGKGTFEYGTGLKYVGDWQNGKEHGQGRMTMTNGSTYEGEYKDGRPHGYGIYHLWDGSKYDGEWQDGLAEGHGLETKPNGSSYEGHWRNGLPNGYGVSTYGGGEDKEGYWVDGEFAGKDRPWNVD